MTTVIFRDGPREVIDYLADMMSTIETYRMTYEEALSIVNNSFMNDHLKQAQTKLITEHFKQKTND